MPADMILEYLLHERPADLDAAKTEALAIDDAIGANEKPLFSEAQRQQFGDAKYHVLKVYLRKAASYVLEGERQQLIEAAGTYIKRHSERYGNSAHAFLREPLSSIASVRTMEELRLQMEEVFEPVEEIKQIDQLENLRRSLIADNPEVFEAMTDDEKRILSRAIDEHTAPSERDKSRKLVDKLQRLVKQVAEGWQVANSKSDELIAVHSDLLDDMVGEALEVLITPLTGPSLQAMAAKQEANDELQRLVDHREALRGNAIGLQRRVDAAMAEHGHAVAMMHGWYQSVLMNGVQASIDESLAKGYSLEETVANIDRKLPEIIGTLESCARRASRDMVGR